MKNLTRLVLIICLLLSFLLSKADVIYSPVTHMSAVVSLEGIASYELAFLKSNTLNLWGGGGFVFPFGGFSHPAYGTEAAIELRQYFTKNTFQNMNLGLYTGLAYMYAPELYRGRLVDRVKSVGIVPGLKLTYKLNLIKEFVAEPYISLSVPFYEERFDRLLKDNADGGLVITIGVRFGYNHVKKLFKN